MRLDVSGSGGLGSVFESEVEFCFEFVCDSVLFEVFFFEGVPFGGAFVWVEPALF